MIAKLKEQRGEGRLPSNAVVMVRQGTTEMAGELLNISNGGFCAKLERFVASNAPVRVTLDGGATLEARLAWGHGQVYGFEFTQGEPGDALHCEDQAAPAPISPQTDSTDDPAEPSRFTGYSRFGGAAAALVLASLEAVGATVQGIGHRIKSLFGG